MVQDKLIEEKDEFVESLNLTPEKIKEDFESVKSIEGFPKGEDEDILALSELPYYASFPNPYIKEFIEYYGTPYDEKMDDYNIEPFSDDVSYGRTDSVYNIHFYHTKVPPQAITNYIKHYTKPNDIVLDFFAGSGMTGVSALRLNRNPVLIDLGPFPTFIEYNNLSKINLAKFKKFAYSVYNNVFNKYSYLYSVGESKKTQRNFTVWSEVQICPFCNQDYVFYFADNSGRNKIRCPHCQAELKINKTHCKIGEDNKGIFVPVTIYYLENNKKQNLEITDQEKAILKEIDDMSIPYWIPNVKLPLGYNTSQPIKSHGFTEVADFFTKRNLLVISAFFDEIKKYPIEDIYKKKLIFAITASMTRLTKLNRYMPSHNRHVGPLSGTLYIPKLFAEINPFKNIKEKIDAVLKADYNYVNGKYVISNQSATDLKNIPNNSIDYIFIDPPFGENLMYSELNFIFEAWIKNFTENKDEAIINSYQNKEEIDYSHLMHTCLNEAYRVLKPKRWITLEFHNSKASIWKIIQESIVKSGFVIAQVLTLDKQKGTTKQLSYNGTVENDLIINAYKPNDYFRNNFIKSSGINMEYEFIQMQLSRLPIEANIERTHQMLYSKLLAQYIQNGFEVKMDATDLYSLLNQKFIERDGYWFNQNQIKEYESKSQLYSKIDKDEVSQSSLDIFDEKSAIIWLVQFLKEPKTYSEIHIEYLKRILTTNDKMPELKDILNENFITENGKYRLPTTLEHNKVEDIRNKHLQKEFDNILEEINSSKKKIKEVRKEALLYGLMNLYKEKEVDLIKTIGNRVDRNIIDSDDDISTIIDWAMYK